MAAEPRIRIFAVAAVALAYPATEAGFQIGAYGELFMARKIAAWALVTAVLVALLLLPRRQRPVSGAHLLLLAFPSAWLLLAFVHAAEFSGEVLHPVVFGLGLAGYLICLPFSLYLIAALLNPELAALRSRRARLSLVGLGLFFLAAGYLLGARNDLFMTCQDFEAAGAVLPSNCRADPSPAA